MDTILAIMEELNDPEKERQNQLEWKNLEMDVDLTFDY